jgi:hypothetical protein
MFHPRLNQWIEPPLGSSVQYDFYMGIRWLISNFILSYQRRNRAGRIGFALVSFGIIGMIQRTFLQSPPGAFGGIPAIIFVTGIFFTFIGWLLSIIYPQRRL